MEETTFYQHNQSFKVHADGLGLANDQFANTIAGPDDNEQIVNEQEQNEIVNPAEETFNEEPAPVTGTKEENTPANEPGEKPLEKNVIDLDPDKDSIDDTGKISKLPD